MNFSKEKKKHCSQSQLNYYHHTKEMMIRMKNILFTSFVSCSLKISTRPIKTTIISIISTTPAPSSSNKKFLNPNIIFPFYILKSMIAGAITIAITITIISIIGTSIFVPASSPILSAKSLLSSNASSDSFSNASHTPLLPL